MNPPSSPLPPPTGPGGAGYPHKRARHSPPVPGVLQEPSPRSFDDTTTAESLVALGTSAGKAGHSSSFRNVSACNRCRLRKNRCDQRLPSCVSCEKASVKCVGYDPITKREIPRSYVFYLETRVEYLEKVLQDNGISFAPAEVLDQSSRPGTEPNIAQPPNNDVPARLNGIESLPRHQKQTSRDVAWNKKQEESEKLNTLVSNIGSVSVQGASDSRYLGSTSGISFARVVFAAVKSSVSGANSDKNGVRPSRPPTGNKSTSNGETSMRDSFFGLQTKPTIKQAPFPSKDVGRRLVELYFEHANPQIPILHRGDFMKIFESAYADEKDRLRGPRELYMLNIVFAIGSGIFLGDSGEPKSDDKGSKKKEGKKRSDPGKQCQPEEYHASAIVHLESCLSSPNAVERPDGIGGGLEELQSVLLLAGFALLRPVAPGLWYIIGVAVRLAVDLGLHYEDGKDIDAKLDETVTDAPQSEVSDVTRIARERSKKARGRRNWIRDFRRRLWWCTYSFDRLVSTCVGRPFGITDQVVTTEFPSLLDDKYITPTGFQEPPLGEPSYKHASYHYFRLRLLQSEILQVLQHQMAQQARAGGANRRNPFMHTTLPSPFLSKFDSFRSWRIDIDRRLYEWKISAPTKEDTGVDFSVQFLELNYWQCIIMLYRQSLSVPQIFEGEFNTSEEVESPNIHNVELREDEERVFLKVAEAGQRVLRLYRQLHRVHLVNYTFLTTHHLFMAGISFLYAIWHSAIVRSQPTMDEVDFTILAATSVLGDLIEKCPPAEACRDAFDRMSKATVQMCMSTTGFGTSAQGGLHSRRKSYSHDIPPHTQGKRSHDYFSQNNASRPSASGIRPEPIFDMGLNDLLSPQTTASPTAGPSPHFRSGSTSTPTGIKTEYSSSTALVRPNANANQKHQTSSSEYVASPPLSSFDPAIDPSLLPAATSPESVQGRAYSQTVQAAYAQNPYQELEFSFNSAPGMDFLQGNGWDGGNGGEAANWSGDLGIGLPWEGLDNEGTGHDFSEGGNGVDLFEGFFFGGTGG